MPTNPSPDEYLPLLKTQRNAAFGWVSDLGFDPTAFDVGPADWGGATCTRFAYRGSPYFFDISTARSSYSVRHSPGASELLTHQMSFTTIFEPVEEPFKAWLFYLRRELDAPDLWDLLQDGQMGLPPFQSDSNEPFSAPELAQVVVRIDAARTYLIDAGVTGKGLDEANGKLDYLVAAAKRSGRMDWMNIAFSVLFGIATQVAFDPNRARELIQFVLSFVAQLRLQ